MKKVFKWKRVAIDFDGTLIENVPSDSTTDEFFRESKAIGGMYGAAEVTRWLQEEGFEILIYTCRQDYQRKYIERQLDRAGITYDYIVFYAKPHADLYIDDKGFRFHNWNDTKSWIKDRLRLDDEIGTIQQEAADARAAK